MRRNILTVATGSFLALGAASLAAQDKPRTDSADGSAVGGHSSTDKHGDKPEAR